MVVSGHSQSLQLTGLGKSLPLICQQQPRLNYKRRIYSAHTEGTPSVPSLGDRGGCCHWTLQDTYYIRPHYQDTESKQLYLIYRNKHREAAKQETKKHAHMKEQIKTPEKELNELEISNLSDGQFKTVFIRTLKELSEDPRSIKKIHSEMKGTLIEIKNNFQGNNSRMDEAKNQLNDLEHKEAKKQPQNKKKESPQNEDNINSLWDNFKRSNICIIGVLEEEKEPEIGNLFKKIMK